MPSRKANDYYAQPVRELTQLDQRSHSDLQDLTADDHPNYRDYWQKTVAGRYFNGTHCVGQTSVQAIAKNGVYFFPIYFGNLSTVDAIALSINTGVAGANVSLAAYLDDGTFNAPGLLLANLGTYSAAAAGIVQVVFGSVAFAAGTFFWMAVSCNVNTVQFDATATEGWAPYGCTSPASPTFASNLSDQSSVFSGTWAANASSYTLAYDSGTYPFLFLRGA